MALGTGETTLLRLTTAYSMVVNGGKRITSTFVDRIQDRDGATIFRADQRPCAGCTDVAWQRQPPPVITDARDQVADPGSTFQIVSMMQGVVEPALSLLETPSPSIVFSSWIAWTCTSRKRSRSRFS